MISEGLRLGAQLRARRETLGLSLEDAEAATRIRSRYLLALEADDWQKLPGEVAGRGFLRNYAEFLKLDGHSLRRSRRSQIDTKQDANWAGISAGAPMPPQRAMDYEPLDAQPSSDFALAVTGARAVWKGLIIVALILAAIAAVTVLFLSDPTLGQPARALAATLAADARGWAQEARSALTSWSTAPAGGGDQTDTPLIVEVPAPTPTSLPPTPEPTPEPTPDPAPEPTPAPTATPAAAPETAAAEAPSSSDAAPLPSAVCETEGMRITYPPAGESVGGVVSLQGTAAVPDQWYYKLEYRLRAGSGQAQPQAFTYFDGYVASVTDGTLGELNTVFMANGDYTLRLTAVQRESTEPFICDVPITVVN